MPERFNFSFLYPIADQKIERVVFLTDGCPGDNKNRYTVHGVWLVLSCVFYTSSQSLPIPLLKFASMWLSLDHKKKTELVQFAAETETPTEYITSIAGHGKNLYDSEGAGAIA